jgi:hypothetical protein
MTRASDFMFCILSQLSLNLAVTRIQLTFATGREAFGAAWQITASMLLGVQCLAPPDC